MPAEKTGVDSVRCYLTGAASAGGAQTDPDASLGKYRSSTEAPSMAVSVAGGPANVTVDWAAGANGAGTGTLTAATTGSLTWTPPGGTEGDAVTIANGETKLLEGGDEDADACVRVTRTSADNLTGTATVTVADTFNNAWGLDNITSAEAAAGDDEIRCICLRIESALAVQNMYWYLGSLGTQAVSDVAQLGASGSGTLTTSNSFADWPDSGWCWIRQSNGTSREVVYYSARTATSLTVPAAGREEFGTTAAAGAATDTLDSIPGVEIAREWPDPGAAAFTGAGLDDATYGGSYKGQTDRTIRVKIDAEGTPDTFTWSDDGGSTWEASGVAITGSAQTLDYGVTVTFAATTGHTANDLWDSACTATATDKTGSGEGSIPAGLTWNFGISTATGISIGTLEADEQVFLWTRRRFPAGLTAEASVLRDVRVSFDAA